MSPPVFVISLARAVERQADIVRRLEAATIRHEIVDAVDGNTLDLSQIADRMDEKTQTQHYGRLLYRGEIGCYLSHYNLWQRIVAEEIPAAVVLEDDAVWDSDFAQVVAAVADCDYEWDVAALHFPTRKNRRVVCNLGGKHQLVAYKRFRVFCTTGYLISLSGAKKLTAHCRLIRHPIDIAWQWPHRWGGRFYCVRPPVVADSDSDSFIEKMAKESGEYSPATSRQVAPSGFVRYWERKGMAIAAWLYYRFSPIKRKP